MSLNIDEIKGTKDVKLLFVPNELIITPMSNKVQQLEQYMKGQFDSSDIHRVRYNDS